MTPSQQQAIIIVSAFAILLLYALYLTGVGAGNSGGASDCAKYTVGYQNGNKVKIFDLPAKAKIIGVTLKHSAQFNPGTMVSIGTESDPRAYQAEPFDVSQPISDAAMRDDGGHYSTNFASHGIFAHFTSPVQLTQGSLDVYICISKLP